MRKMKSCENCVDMVCRMNRYELCKDQDTEVWSWSSWQSKELKGKE